MVDGGGHQRKPRLHFLDNPLLGGLGRQVGTEGVLDFIYSVGHVRDLLLSAKHLFVAAILAGPPAGGGPRTDEAGKEPARALSPTRAAGTAISLFAG